MVTNGRDAAPVGAESAAGRPWSGPSLADYGGVAVFLLAVGTSIALMPLSEARAAPPPDALIAPMGALVALTAVVWLLMVLVRNIAVLGGRISARHFVDYGTPAVDERIERPARTFNNLFQVPLLFYVACLLMMVSLRIDRAQVELAWLFVMLRALHAVVYIGWNHVPSRFASWLAGCITLGVIWVRIVF